MTKYARDEFDRVPETSTRQGVHRAVAASRSHRRRLVPILAVGAAALAVGLLSFLVLPKLGLSSAGSTQAVSVEQGGSSAAASPAPTASGPAPTSTAASATPSAAATPSVAATPSAATTPSAAAAVVDKAQPVGVFNATTTAGLANRVGGTVSSAGWTVGTLGNWGGVAQQRSVIFYGGAAQKANAEALGKLLGITTVVDSADFELPLVVVLGPGFK